MAAMLADFFNAPLVVHGGRSALAFIDVVVDDDIARDAEKGMGLR
jgi:hypothetical protein